MSACGVRTVACGPGRFRGVAHRCAVRCRRIQTMTAHATVPEEGSNAPVRGASDLPDYDDLLSAYHAAFAPELERAVRAVPLPEPGCVLDAPCGDGFYAACLARRLGPAGRVVAVDLSS